MDAVGGCGHWNARAARLRHLRHFIEALRMTRDDQNQSFRGTQIKVLKKQLLFPFARAGKEEHGPAERLTPGASSGELTGVGRRIELEVSAHLNPRCPERAQPLGIRGALRAHGRERGECRAGQAAQPRVAAGGLLRHARVREHERNPARGAGVDQIRPYLGFHDHAQTRPEIAEEALHRRGQVVRNEARFDGVAIDLPQGLAAGGRRAGHQDAVVRKRSLQRPYQGRRGARLAHGDRVYPHQPLWFRQRIAAETLGDIASVSRLAPAAPPQAEEDQGHADGEQHAVQAPHWITWRTASSTSTTCGGRRGAPTLRARRAPYRPVSAGSEPQKIATAGAPEAAARCDRPLSNPTTVFAPASTRASASSVIFSGTSASPIPRAMRSARPRSSEFPQGSITASPSARPRSIQRSSGQSLSVRLVIVSSTE